MFLRVETPPRPARGRLGAGKRSAFRSPRPLLSSSCSEGRKQACSEEREQACVCHTLFIHTYEPGTLEDRIIGASGNINGKGSTTTPRDLFVVCRDRFSLGRRRTSHRSTVPPPRAGKNSFLQFVFSLLLWNLRSMSSVRVSRIYHFPKSPEILELAVCSDSSSTTVYIRHYCLGIASGAKRPKPCTSTYTEVCI